MLPGADSFHALDQRVAGSKRGKATEVPVDGEELGDTAAETDGSDTCVVDLRADHTGGFDDAAHAGEMVTHLPYQVK